MSGCEDFQLGMGEYFTLLCLHIETFRVSNNSCVSVTQIGVTTGLNNGQTGDREEMFLAVRPQGLQDCLDNYKLEGDLLRALHMTQEEGGHFLFRDRFSARDPDKDVIVCLDQVLL